MASTAASTAFSVAKSPRKALSDGGNPFNMYLKALKSEKLYFYDISAYGGDRIDGLPFCVRVLLESSMRSCDGFEVEPRHVEAILNMTEDAEIRFRPARTILQDFTGIPTFIDLAAIREAVKSSGGDPAVVQPACPTDLIVDYSLRSDLTGRPGALAKNEGIEFKRNKELYQFLKWAGLAFENVTMTLPPGSGIPHQIHLEYLGRIVINDKGLLYPDTVLGTDSHMTMVNGMGILGWGVSGVDIESVILGHAVTMAMPKVVGYKMFGEIGEFVTSTNIVLSVTKHLRQIGVSGNIVEFFGPGVVKLSVADRVTISNMCPEYGALAGFFAVDKVALEYLKQKGESAEQIECMEAYLREAHLLRDYEDMSHVPAYSEVYELDFATIVASVSGPKRPQDRVSVSDMKDDFPTCLTNEPGLKGFGISSENLSMSVPFFQEDKLFTLKHGSIVIAAITSCTNSSNPSVMLAAGLLAKKAVECGLSVPDYVKTSLSPGSGIVTYYLEEGGVIPYFNQLGFDVDSSLDSSSCEPLPQPIQEAIGKGDLVTVSILSGNRNFENRLNPLTQANYLASPLLVIAYALAGNMAADFDKQPLGKDAKGKSVYLRDIWPSRDEIQAVERNFVIPGVYKEIKSKMTDGTPLWNSLADYDCLLYPWERRSTYIQRPPYFKEMSRDAHAQTSIDGAYVLLHLGDSVLSDWISPAGSISRHSCAARYLALRGLVPREFYSYGCRRGNWEVMTRSAFSHPKLINKFLRIPGASKTLYLPSGEIMDIYDAAMKYSAESRPLVILAGKSYGCGSSRDWAAKGPFLLGVRAVLAESFDPGHRACLVDVGILPLEYLKGQSAASLNVTGREVFSIETPSDVSQVVTVKLNCGLCFKVKSRIDTRVELACFHGRGMLNCAVTKAL
eukprot:m.308240 g.308240  ORF g.308240 m.308240 type:complete len:902 (+) comp43627_c0_seq1:53-2758(+)